MSDHSIVWVNGELVSEKEVRASPFDLGLTVGLGAFETMSAYSGKPFLYDQHDERLRKSAAVLSLTVPDSSLLRQAVTGVIIANGLSHQRARVRITITAGKVPLSGAAVPSAQLVLVTAVAQPEPKAMAKLVDVDYQIDERSPLAGVKSASYAANVLAYRDAIAKGADEAVIYNHQSELAECSMSNIFLVKGGKVFTPQLSSGCLAGVTRSAVIRLCQQNNISITECKLVKADLEGADEVFITSSARGVQPAQILDTDMKFVVTREIQSLYVEMIASY